MNTQNESFVEFIVKGITIVLLIFLIGFILPTLNVQHPQPLLIWLSRASLLITLSTFFVSAYNKEPKSFTLTAVLTGITSVLVFIWKIQTVNQSVLVNIFGVLVCLYVLYYACKIVYEFVFGVPMKPIDL